jgi:hypothetical protein
MGLFASIATQIKPVNIRNKIKPDGSAGIVKSPLA